MPMDLPRERQQAGDRTLYNYHGNLESGNARHRDRIEDIGLLIPLAQRWQDEIWRHATDQASHTTPVPALEGNISTPYAYATPATSTPSDTTTLYTPTASQSYNQNSAQTSFNIHTSPSKTIASSSSYQDGSPRSPTTTELALQPLGNQPRYDLRPREANISTDSTFTQPMSTSQVPLSEFRAHVADPRPKDSVSRKILHPLEGRDFETGSLYIFDRASSPGHVKIGWTASSIRSRLEYWSTCGYNPNLLFSVYCVPHAQRVETLTHHELIKDWRRERMCKAPLCRKSHQEWFEISKERAAQVLSDWADFMKKAEPYDSKGLLKTGWREVIEMMDGNGEMVTAKTLLEHYEASLLEEATLIEEVTLIEDATLVKELAGLGRALKMEEVVEFAYGSKVGRLEGSKEASVRAGSLRIEQSTLPKGTPLLKSEGLPKQIPLVENLLPKAEKESKSDPMLKRKPLSKTESLPRPHSMFTAEPPFEIEPFSQTGPPFGTDPPSKSEPVHEKVLAPERTPVKKELSPEQIPLPSSPLLQSTTFHEDTVCSQETKPNLSTETDKTSAIHVITKSDTNITVVDTSPNPKINSSVSASTLASLSTMTSPSATPSKDIPQTNTSTNTNFPPLNFSDPVSEPNPSDSSVTPASPRFKAEPVSDPPGQLLTEISEALLSLSTDEQEKLAETLTSITQRQQNVEGDGQAEPEGQLLACYGQTREEEIKSHHQDESTAAENGTGTGADGWDAEDTLVENQTTRSLEKAVLELVDELYDEISTGKADGSLKGLDGLNALESEVPPVVEVVAQA